MQEVIRGDAQVIRGLSALATGSDAIRHSSDSFGNGYHWFRLDTPRHLSQAATVLQQPGARLTMVSACKKTLQGEQDVCYHFELTGVIYTVTVTLNGQWPSLPSITRLFANADWHEREMMELYGIPVSDQPNPRRLFLDEDLDAGLLKEVVPLSIMMNGACSTDLWERI
ncbi:MAG: NADH-quinone oxidoreductase subunit C, partial [Desulfovibrionaceae bacterium]|nr:NADH-quinone oxidoreductase subunit C [Desulfovibrionaceae bacterium]